MDIKKENTKQPWSNIWKCLHCQEPAIYKLKGSVKVEIVFVLKGSLDLTIGSVGNINIEEGNMTLIPPHTSYQIELKEGSHIVSIRFSLEELFSGQYPFFQLSMSKRYKYKTQTSLQVNKLIKEHLYLTETYINDKMPVRTLFELKRDEFFYLLFHTYDLAELAEFLLPLLKRKIILSVG